MKLIMVLIVAVSLCVSSLSAQENGTSNSNESQRSEPRKGPTLETIDQHNTYPDGSVHDIHLIKESVAWSNELHGYLITARAKEEEPALVSLDAGKLTPSDLPTKILDIQYEFTSIDLHTDIKVTQVFGKTEKQQALEFSGKLSYCLVPSFTQDPNKLSPLAGLPGTRLDLSPLFAKQQQLVFLGRSWQPMSDKQAIVLVTQKSIEAYMVKVTDTK